MKFREYLYTLVILLFSTTVVFSSEKIVFLDIDYILNNSNLGKSISIELNKINKKNIKELNELEKILKDKKEKINKTKNISTKEKLKEDIKLFNEEVEKFRSKKNIVLKEFKSKKKIELDNFLLKIKPIIQNYMKNNSINIVFEQNQIFMGNKNIDITNNIIELINKEFKDNG
jgi:outer membrane protein